MSSKNGHSWLLLILGRQVTSNDARLTALWVEGGNASALAPDFDPAGTGAPYTCLVDRGTTAVTIHATAAVGATIALDDSPDIPFDGDRLSVPLGNPALAEHTDFSVIVTAQNRTTTLKYDLRVEWRKSDDNTLSDLEVSAGALDPAFVPDITSYTDVVPFSAAEVMIAAWPNDAAATVTINGEPRSWLVIDIPDSLLPPDNMTQISVPVVVTAESGAVRTYTVLLKKNCEDAGNCPPEPLDEARLSSLSVSGGTSLSPAFNPDDSYSEYETIVPRKAASVTITAVPVSPAAAVTIDGSPMGGDSMAVAFSGEEEQTYAVLVTAEDGTTTRTYILTVLREPCVSADLKGLAVSSGVLSPGFNSGLIDYTDLLPHDATFIYVTASVECANAVLTIDSDTAASGEPAEIDVSSLPADGVTHQYVTVMVTQDGGAVSKTYTIELTKQQAPCDGDGRLSGLALSEGSLEPAFDPDTFLYEVEVAETTTVLTFTPNAVCPDAEIMVGLTNTTSGIGVAVDVTVKPAVVDIVVTDPAGGSETYTVTVISGCDTESRLSEVTISEGVLNPEFDPDTQEYWIAVPCLTTVDVIATTMSDGATLTIDGVAASSGTPVPVSQSLGAKDVIVEVTPECGGVARTYIIHMSFVCSSDASLSALSTDIGTWDGPFATGDYDYTVNPRVTDAEVVVTATATDPYATININYQGASPQTVALGGVGTTTDIPVLVTAQDGVTTQTYTLHVVKPYCGCASLSALATDIGAWDGPFATGDYEYTITVDDDTAVVVTATATLPEMIISINSQGASPETVTLGARGTTTDIPVVVTMDDGTDTVTYTLHVVRPPGDDASLSALATDIGTWNGPFATGDHEYTVTVDDGDTAVVVTAAATDPLANININSQGSSPQTIALGFMGTTTEVAVLVTAQDGTTTETYLLYVVRPLSCCSSLSMIETDVGTWDTPFATGDYDYTVTVDSTNTSVVVSAVAEDPYATININYQGASPQTVALGAKGTTTDIPVVVTAQNGTWTLTYTLHVVRLPGDDASLLALMTDVGTWDTPFSPGDYDYTVQVDLTDASLVVTATATDPNAYININGQGESPQTVTLGPYGMTTEVAVLVMAQDGTTTRTYTLHVYKTCLCSTNLSSLSTDLGTWDGPFETGDYDYTVTVDSTNTSVVVSAVAEDPYATININYQGPSPETVTLGARGTTTDIPVVVMAEDGTTTLTYTLHVVRPLGDDANLSALSTDLGTWNTPFTPSTYTYTVTTGGYDTSVVVTATATDPYATININSQGASPQTIALGSMGTTTEVAVLVTAQDGTTTLTYTLYVVRPSTCPPSIWDITTSPVGTWDSPFATGDYDYTVTVDDEVAAVVVTVTADPELSIVINSQGGSPQTVALGPPGSTTDVSVVAVWDYTITTYTLHIVRPMGDDASLSALATDIGTWDTPFSPGDYEYTVTVDANDASVVVIATATDPNAYININSQGASPQMITLPGVSCTEVAVLVTAQNATTTQTYTIYFYRLI